MSVCWCVDIITFGLLRPVTWICDVLVHLHIVWVKGHGSNFAVTGGKIFAEAVGATSSEGFQV